MPPGATGVKIGDAYMKVHADTSEAEQALSKDLPKAAQNSEEAVGPKGLSGGIKNIGAIAKVAVAGAAVAAVAKLTAYVGDSIAAFSELEQSTGAVNAVFKENAAEIQAFAEQAGGTIGLSVQDAQQGAAVLASTLKAFGFDADSATDKTQQLLTLGADMSAMFGGTVPDAVGALTSALRGEFNPLERYGVSLRNTTVMARAVELGLAEAGGEVDDMAKSTAVLDLITKQTVDTQGQFGRETETIAGKQAILAAEAGNTSALLGESLAPAYGLVLDAGSAWQSVLEHTALSLGELLGSISDADVLLHRVSEGWDADTTAAQKFGDTIVGVQDSYGHYLDAVIGGEQAEKDFEDITIDSVLALNLKSEELAKLEPQIASIIRANLRDAETEAAVEEAVRKAIIAQKEEEDQLIENKLRAGELTYVNGELVDVITGDVIPAEEDLRSEVEKNNDALEANIQWLADRHDALRAQSDPIFAIFKAEQDVAKARENYQKVLDDEESTDADITAARIELAEATGDLTFAEEEAAIQTDLTKEAFINQQIQMGNTRTEAELLADDLDDLEGFEFGNKVMTIRGEMDERLAKLIFGTHTGTGGFQEFAQLGGPVQAGMPYTVGEQGRELFVPNLNGAIVPNARTEQMLAGMGTATAGGGVSIVQNFYVEPTPTPQTQRAFQEAASVIGIMQ